MNRNYRITASDRIGNGGAKTKAKANLDAIRLLKELEAEQRSATPEEQAVLVKFSGWGTIADIFTSKPEWAALQNELKSLLIDTEFESARAAILNAHYTDPAIAATIYEGLEQLGFQGGKIFDPSMGATGIFEGSLPDAWRDATEIVGVELDSLSGRIAQQLYPDASIHIRGFEDTVLPDEIFDLAVTNVPFSEVGVADPEYKGLPINTLHDYFFAKALDKVRPGGLLAFITSTGTMQSASSEGARELLSSRANLVGAMRLPSSAFKQVAGTEVTTDLIILQKLGDGVEPNGVAWIKLEPSSTIGIDGVALPTNEYYAQNPHLMLGTPSDDKLHPGRLALTGDGRDIKDAIRGALKAFPVDVYHPLTEQAKLQPTGILIPPDLQDSVKPYGYVMYEDQIMQRVGYYLEASGLEGKKFERMQGMLAIRDAVQTVFEVQLQNGSENELQSAQTALNQTYDQFVKSYGYLNQTANKLVFREDPDYPLLLALENYDQENKTAIKTAIFSDRVIQSHNEKTEASTSKEALLYSLNERGRVDLSYIAQLVKQSEADVTTELQQERLIFLDPKKTRWVTEDEYLSGDVKSKLKIAEEAAKEDAQFATNVEALQAVQPALIPPGDIEVRLGAAWVPPTDVRDFAMHLLEASSNVDVHYSSFLDVWSVDADYRVSGSVKNTKVFGTDRVGALRLIELGLNLKDPVVYDRIDEQLVVNQDATAAARMKLEEIKVAFKDWVWQNPERTERLTNLYNDKFNTFRPRQYNGAHLELPGSNPAIQLRPHQKDAAWRVLQEGNSLLAHCVGAGKTFTSIAAVMEQKRLGIANKPMLVVPNHLLEQWAGDFKRLYPNSNILAATKDDSSAQNRQELMSRIATGNWDAVIVTHSAFSKLRMSKDAQLSFYHSELDQVIEAVEEAKGDSSGSRSMVKELERQKKRLEKRIDEVANSRKDNSVTFEQLGVDQIYVDEAHYFKNLGYHTKMYGIAGLPNTTSDRAFDLFMKCRYLSEQHGDNKGVVFATGTPVSNSMAELYTMQRYLQPQALRQIGLEHFDAWASTFGETVTAPEITPAGGYKVKTRFSRFVNIPELMNTFRQVADIQTAEMLNLPTPQLKGGKPEVVAVAASDLQLAFVEELAKRAENVKNVDPRKDNMLLITTDGRKASLDMRLINSYFPHERNKVDQLIDDAYEFWNQTKGDRTTHLIFCDMGTPKEDADSKKSKQINVEKHFTVYSYIKNGLVAKGVPPEEIAFAQEFKTDAQKLEMQQKFNAGKLRVLISGSQLETGFNGQKKLGLESHLTVPWRPDQVEQRDGRILRQGNENPEVEIRRYVTQGRDGRPSFDSYMWQTLETKKKFISQVMAGNSEVRSMEDVAAAALTYAEVKAIATGNPLIMEKAEVDNRVSQLAAQKRSYLNQHYSINQELKWLPARIDELAYQIQALKTDVQRVPRLDNFVLTIQGTEFTDIREAMKCAKARVVEKQMEKDFSSERIGKVGGFDLLLQRERWGDDMNMVLRGQQDYLCEVEHTYVGTASKLINVLSNIEPRIQETEWKLADSQKKLAELSLHSNDPFPKEAELQAALKRQTEINTELGLNKDNAQATEEIEGNEVETQPEAEVTIVEGDEDSKQRVEVDTSVAEAETIDQQVGAIALLEVASTENLVEQPVEPSELVESLLVTSSISTPWGDLTLNVFEADEDTLRLEFTGATANWVEYPSQERIDFVLKDEIAAMEGIDSIAHYAEFAVNQIHSDFVQCLDQEANRIAPDLRRWIKQTGDVQDVVPFMEQYPERQRINLTPEFMELAVRTVVEWTQDQVVAEMEVSQPAISEVVVPERSTIPTEATTRSIGFTGGDNTTLVHEYGSLSVLPREVDELRAIFSSGSSDIQMKKDIAQLFEEVVPSEYLLSVVEVVWNECQHFDIPPEELPSTEITVESQPYHQEILILDTPGEATQDAQPLELQQAEEILRIAAIAYAHAGSKGQIELDGEFWTAKGKHYDISYNPTNENFFVVGKDGSQMEAQRIGGELDPDCCSDISSEDVARFQKTEEVLLSLQSTFNPSLLPAQTQAIAQQHLEAVEDSTQALADELGAWHKQAVELGRPANYLQRIEQVQSAAQQGEQPTERAIQAMHHDQEAWKQQASLVLSDAIAILERVGIQDEQGKHFNGKTYQVSLAATGALTVSATERGELMQAQGGAIVSASVTKADLEQFHQFVNYLQSVANLLQVQERSKSAVERDV